MSHVALVAAGVSRVHVFLPFVPLVLVLLPAELRARAAGVVATLRDELDARWVHIQVHRQVLSINPQIVALPCAASGIVGQQALVLELIQLPQRERAPHELAGHVTHASIVSQVRPHPNAPAANEKVAGCNALAQTRVSCCTARSRPKWGDVSKAPRSSMRNKAFLAGILHARGHRQRSQLHDASSAARGCPLSLTTAAISSAAARTSWK